MQSFILVHCANMRKELQSFNGPNLDCLGRGEV